MRKINGCVILLSFLVVAACISEVKPILKPTQLDIPARIADDQKWIDQAVATKSLTFNESRPIQAKLYQIKEKYNLLQSTGKLTDKDSEKINEMLDDCSDLLFRAVQKRRNY